MTTPLHFQDATALAADLRARRVTSEQVLTALIERIRRHNGPINAVVTLDEDNALRRAREADAAASRNEWWGPLHGVPFTAKDGFETAGLRTTASHAGYANYVPAADATVVARLKNAGAILVGKTNLSELAQDTQCNSPVFGRANNPWDRSRTTGGSTGGGAAAVAMGFTPLELGSDVGGSIRIPASYCGVYGFKPTEHRIPTTGHIEGRPGALRGTRHVFCVGPLARSVRDLRLALEILAGPDGIQTFVPPVPLDRGDPIPVEKLRLAWWDDLGGLPLAQDIRDALARTVEALQSRGARVERAFPDGFDFLKAWTLWGEIVGGEGFVGWPAALRHAAKLMALMPGPIQKGMARAASLDMRTHARALNERDVLLRALDRFFERFDAWLIPVGLAPAFEHCRMGTRIPVDGKPADYWLAAGAGTCAVNVTGQPAIALPAGIGKAGLPIGIQLVGRRWHDLALLAAADTVSTVLPLWQPPPDAA